MALALDVGFGGFALRLQGVEFLIESFLGGFPRVDGAAIWQMGAQNPTWGEERIANELKLKLGIRVSARTVAKYLRQGGPRRTPDPKQRWLTFVRNHAKVVIACDFFIVITRPGMRPWRATRHRRTARIRSS